MVSSVGMRMETVGRRRVSLNTLFCLLVRAGTPQTSRKLGFGLLELGVHLPAYRQMLWHCVEAGFCMRWETGQEERVCVSHYMKDNVHEHLEVCHPQLSREEDYLFIVGKFEIQPENGFQVIWSPKGLRGGCYIFTLSVCLLCI